MLPRLILAAALMSAAPTLADTFSQDPAVIGKKANAWFASRSMSSRFSEPACRAGAHLKSCLYGLGPVEIVAHGLPSSEATSKITVQLNEGSADDAALFLIAAVAIMAVQAPAISQDVASNELAEMVKGAAAEGKQSKILDGTYFSVMKIGSEFVFTAMPE